MRRHVRRHRRLRGRHQREVGREDAERAVEGHQRAREDDEVAGQPDAELGQGRHQVLEDRGLDGAGRAHVLGHEPGERPFETLGRHRFADFGHPLDAVAQQAHVAAVQRRQDVDDGGLLDRIEPTDRAEVDQPERAVLEREDVARVRVGVEEAEPQHLIERGPQQLLGQRGAVDVRRVRAVRCRPG